MTMLPASARCALHTGTAAVAVCERCGNYACAGCISSRSGGLCAPCAARLSPRTSDKWFRGPTGPAQIVTTAGIAVITATLLLTHLPLVFAGFLGVWAFLPHGGFLLLLR